MAVGSVTSNGTIRKVCVMSAAVANVAKPSAVTDGVSCYATKQEMMRGEGADVGLCFLNRDAGQSTLMIKGRVTAGQTLVGTFTLWGYSDVLATWFEIPVNGGTAITPVALAETDSDEINYQERFNNLGHYDRIALQLTSIGGTGATFDAYIVSGRFGE